MRTTAEDRPGEWKLSPLGLEDLDEIMALYDSVKGRNGCIWDEAYPDRGMIADDIRQGELYGIKNEAGRIIAAVARDRDKAVDSLDCWSSALQPAAEFARLVVAAEYQNRGIARSIHLQAMEIMRDRGFKSVHFLVAETNQAAVRSYAVLPYRKVGETDLWGHHYLCFEKAL